MRKAYISLLLVSLFSGLLVAWQLRAHLAIAAKDNQGSSLIGVIKSLEKEDASLEDNISELRQKINDLQLERSQGKSRLIRLQQQLESLELKTGLLPVSGPGITITIDDNSAGADIAKQSSPTTYRPEDFIIHDKNVLYMVNELKAAGAEAIAVNDQRLVNNTDIRCVGTVILINSTRLAPPYEIKVIGNPDALEASIQHAEEFIYLKSRGFPIKVTKSDNLTLPAYNGGFSLKYTHPIETGENE
ncbi:MAG: hypothetical protein PWP31_1845 [Clostridia bacterium]|nr:hypothetical protein [Clostridia bacterium]MDK2901373.1 hypothetical protein [Thermosediminibacterales bacterium]